MTYYYSFNTRRNAFTNINTRLPTAPTPHHHRLHNSIENRNIRNLLRRGARSNINDIVYPVPRLNNNA